MMTSISTSANMVALVQASTTLPIMLFSLASGALADSFDRRRIMLIRPVFHARGLGRADAVPPGSGCITPWLLLAFTFLIGCGTALNNPSWQASVGDMVPRDDLPAAVALNSDGLQPDPQRRPGDRRRDRSGGGCGGGLRRQCAAAIFALIFALLRWKPAGRQRAAARDARRGRSRPACATSRCRPTSAR